MATLSTKQIGKTFEIGGKSFWAAEDTTKIKDLFLGCYRRCGAVALLWGNWAIGMDLEAETIRGA